VKDIYFVVIILWCLNFAWGECLRVLSAS